MRRRRFSSHLNPPNCQALQPYPLAYGICQPFVFLYTSLPHQHLHIKANKDLQPIIPPSHTPPPSHPTPPAPHHTLCSIWNLSTLSFPLHKHKFPPIPQPQHDLQYQYPTTLATTALIILFSKMLEFSTKCFLLFCKN